MLRLSIAALVVASSITCNRKAPAPIADGPIPCASDADCPPAACGPCTAGKVVTDKDVRIECKTNPCVDGGLVCSDEHVCVVRATARAKPPRE